MFSLVIYTLLEMNQREKFFFVIFIFLAVSSRVELQWCLNDMFLCMCMRLLTVLSSTRVLEALHMQVPMRTLQVAVILHVHLPLSYTTWSHSKFC